MGDFTQQGENAGKELFYKSKLSLTPKRKVASPPGRIGRVYEERLLVFNAVRCKIISRAFSVISRNSNYIDTMKAVA